MEAFSILWIAGGDRLIYTMGSFNLPGFGLISKPGLESEKCPGAVPDRGRSELSDVLRVAASAVDEPLTLERSLGAGGSTPFDCFNFDCTEIVSLVIDFSSLTDAGLSFKLTLAVDLLIKVSLLGNCALG